MIYKVIINCCKSKKKKKDLWYRSHMNIIAADNIRCQTARTMCTLSGYQPVIPSVTFIKWSPSIPYYSEGSLCPTYVSGWLLSLSVRYAYRHYTMRNLYTGWLISIRFLAIPYKLYIFLIGVKVLFIIYYICF